MHVSYANEFIDPMPGTFTSTLQTVFELRRCNLEQILREEKDDMRTEDLDRFPLLYGNKMF